MTQTFCALIGAGFILVALIWGKAEMAYRKTWAAERQAGAAERIANAIEKGLDKWHK